MFKFHVFDVESQAGNLLRAMAESYAADEDSLFWPGICYPVEFSRRCRSVLKSGFSRGIIWAALVRSSPLERGLSA